MSDDGFPVDRSDPPRERPRARRTDLDRGGRLLVDKRPSSSVRVPFHEVMDQVKDLPDNVDSFASRQNLVENAPQPVTQHQEDHPSRNFREELERRSRNSDSDSDRKRGSSPTDGDRPRAKVAEEKVIARAPLTDRERQGQGRGEKGGGGSSWQGNRLKSFILPPNLKSLQQGKIQQLGQGPFVQGLKAAQLAQEKKAAAPTVFSKELLDKIVQYVSILTKKDGEKEMDVTLHGNIFKGLRLKVAMAKSKVEVTFLTQKTEVRELFLAHRADIREALGEKGIEVRSINVVMI